MKTTKQRLSGTAAPAVCALVLLGLCLLCPAVVRAQWTTNGNNINNTNTGNVGVGTSSPAAPLHAQVDSDSAVTGTIFENANAGVNAQYRLELALGTDSGTRPGKGLVLFAHPATTGLADYENRRLSFYTGSGAAIYERLSILSTGNVGVGNNAPAHRLDVGGNVNATGMCIAGDCKTAWSQVGGASQWATSGTSIHYGGGNVGVGTTAPGQTLSVAGTGAFYNSTPVQPSGVRALFMGNFSGGSSIWSYNYAAGAGDPLNVSAQHISLNTYVGGNGISRLHINNSGNVGVGTNAPASLLNLVGANAALTFGTAGAIDSSSFSVAVTASGESTNSGNGRGLTVKAGDSDNTAGKVGGHLTLNPGAPVAPATAYGNVLLATAGGNVGVGKSAPTHRLDVAGSVNSTGLCLGGDCKTAWSQVGGASQWATAGTAIHYSGGNVGVGTTSPATKLHVVGDLTVTGNISAKYQDVAEWVPSTQRLEAGAVVVLDRARANHVLASTSAYDTGVAGVVSAAPGVILGEGGEGRLMVATTGRVKIKADARRAPIRVGDLLVTSDVEGVAMKSLPLDFGGTPIHRPGTIIGKALEPLAGGVGEILVLLSLQ